MLETITMNLRKSGKVTRQTLNGRTHVVVPCVMMKEGVWAGSQGAKFYPAQELKNSAPTWNHKPVVLGHPQRDGQGISACSPEVLETTGCGILMNTRWHDARLKTQVWLDEEKTKLVDNGILEALEKGDKVEVSTGLYVDDELVGNGQEESEHDGKKYKVIARNHRPDHLAILMDQKGACSVSDGAGLLANRAEVVPLTGNAQSFMDIQMRLSAALRKSFEKPGYYWDGYLIDVFPESFVYRHGEKLYQQGYTANEGAVTTKGVPVEVVRVTEYRKASDKSYVGNALGEFLSALEKEHMAGAATFDVKAHVGSLIGNGWEESDRAKLEALPPDVLQKIQPTKPAAPVTGNAAPPPVLNWRQVVPAAELAELDRAVRLSAEKKAAIVKELVGLTANTAKPLNEAFLNGKDVDELENWLGLVKTAQPAAPTANQMFLTSPPHAQPFAAPNYGLGFGQVQLVGNENPHKEEPLAAPTINFAKAAK